MKDFYPFTRYCNRDKGYSAHEFYDAFESVRPKNLSYYGYDVIVMSATAVTFVVFGMQCNMYGGVGAEKARLDATVTADITRDSIEQRAARLAFSKRKQELAENEERIIESYAQGILNSI